MLGERSRKRRTEREVAPMIDEAEVVIIGGGSSAAQPHTTSRKLVGRSC